MDKSTALALLKDIHLPSPISWWPLTPAWYAVIALVLLSSGFFCYNLYQKNRYALAKKQALSLLQGCKERYAQEGNVPLTSTQISKLLRRVALVYYPRGQVAGLQGEAWLQFLNQTGKKGLDFNPLKHMLLEAPYKTDQSIDLTPLFDAAHTWIKQRGVPCSN